jgi:hypothetical protein
MVFIWILYYSIDTKKVLIHIAYRVIPARRVSSGDSPGRESFFQKDAGQVGMTKKRSE